MPSHLPIFLNLRDKPCVVIGGGDVALRKVRSLLDCGARVRVIAPAVRPELSELADAGRIEIEARGYRAGDLSAAFLGVAAADDPEVNARARQEASVRRVLINVADDPEGSDYQTPSFFEDGPLTLALSTSGASPAVARTLRRMVQDWLGPDMGRALAVVGAFRDRVKNEVSDPKDRVRFWETAVNAENLELARKGDLAGFEDSLEAALAAFAARPHK